MTINEMKTNVIHKFGFEHPATIYFFYWCEHESENLGYLKEIYDEAMNWEHDEEEDEDW